MPVADRFDATLTQRLPYAWAFADTAVVRRLRAHGVQVERLTERWQGSAERFHITTMTVTGRPAPMLNEVRVGGTWSGTDADLPVGTFVVTAAQPLAILALWLLEPLSDDGLVTWSGFETRLSGGGHYPVVRLLQPLAASRRLAP